MRIVLNLSPRCLPVTRSPLFSLSLNGRFSAIRSSVLRLPVAMFCSRTVRSTLSTSAVSRLDDFPMQSRSASGEIHVIVGPMFAGKTTALLQRVQAEHRLGRNVAVVKSDKDNRYASDSIVTHDGARMPCCALTNLSSFRTKFGADLYNKIDVIGIDEAQFFGDLYEFCREAADRDGKVVVVAGLDGDYLRRKFGCVLDLIPIADSVTKLTARCQFCGCPALFTLRKSKETQTELIGGADVYMPVCRRHHVDGQIVIEAARVVLDMDVASELVPAFD